MVREGSAQPAVPTSFAGTPATVGFSGLAGGAVSENQVNITIPTGITAGTYYLEVLGDDSDNYESPISIGTGTLGVNAVPEAKPFSTAVHPRAQRGLRRAPSSRGIRPPENRPIHP